MSMCWAWKLGRNKAVEVDLLRRFPGVVFCLDVQLALRRRGHHEPRGYIVLAVLGWKLVEVGFYDVRHADER